MVECLEGPYFKHGLTPEQVISSTGPVPERNRPRPTPNSERGGNPIPKSQAAWGPPAQPRPGETLKQGVMATQGRLRMAARSSLLVLHWFKLACCSHVCEDCLLLFNDKHASVATHRAYYNALAITHHALDCRLILVVSPLRQRALAHNPSEANCDGYNSSQAAWNEEKPSLLAITIIITIYMSVTVIIIIIIIITIISFILIYMVITIIIIIIIITTTTIIYRPGASLGASPLRGG